MEETNRVPEDVIEELTRLKGEGESLLRIIRFKDSFSSPTMFWIVHEEPRSEADSRMLDVVSVWNNID